MVVCLLIFFQMAKSTAYYTAQYALCERSFRDAYSYELLRVKWNRFFHFRSYPCQMIYYRHYILNESLFQNSMNLLLLETRLIFTYIRSVEAKGALEGA